MIMLRMRFRPVSTAVRPAPASHHGVPVILRARQREFAEGATDMAFQARVYLQRPHKSSSISIGKILVEILPPGSPLRLHCQIKFTYEGKVEIGRVDGIVPEKWKSGDHTPPMLYVVQT